MKTSHREDVERYCSDVMSGKTITGKQQRLAVERYLADVRDGAERGLLFCEGDADYAINTFSIWKHSIGQFAGKPFELQPWQKFIVWNLWGWKLKESGLRRFKRAYLNVAAKAGKTTFAAGLALLLAIADTPIEQSAEVYIVATALKQAKILSTQALRFVESCPWIRKRSKPYAAEWRIEWPMNHGKLQPFVVGPSADGINAHAIIRDELHAFREKHREGSDKLPSRMASRQQPMLIDITTAGTDASLIWNEEHELAEMVINGVESSTIVDDSYFVFICAIDECDDEFDERNWQKACPSLGVTVPVQYYREQAETAKRSPKMHGRFIRYQCNRKTAAATRAIPAEHWARGCDPIQHALWEEGKGGVDLSRTRDLTSISGVFPVRSDSGETLRWEVMSKSWVASEGRLQLDREPFRTWIDRGLIDVIEGDIIVFDEIEDEIVRWSEVYSVTQWAFDPNRAAELMQRLAARGIGVFPFNQSSRKFNEPCERIQDEFMAGRIRHGNDPVLSWQFSNLEFIEDSNGLIKPNKKNMASKIDAAVATIMAFQGCLFAEKTAGSFYDNNEVEMG